METKTVIPKQRWSQKTSCHIVGCCWMVSKIWKAMACEKNLSCHVMSCHWISDTDAPVLFCLFFQVSALATDGFSMIVTSISRDEGRQALGSTCICVTLQSFLIGRISLERRKRWFIHFWDSGHPFTTVTDGRNPFIRSRFQVEVWFVSAMRDYRRLGTICSTSVPTSST